MKKKPQAKQQGKPVKAGLNFSEKRRLAELKRTLAGNDKKQEKPTTAQNTITFKKMFRDGICQVTSTYYTKMVEFFDINYDLLEIEDQGEILEEYSKFINYFDPSIKFQLFLFNRQVNEQTLIDQFDIPLQGDDFDDIREEYSEMLKKQAAKGNNGIIKSKYLIFGTECKGFKEAKSKLNNIEADVIKNFLNLGTHARSLDGKERLRILHEYFNQDTMEPFRFSFQELSESGKSVKDYIAPPGFDFRYPSRFKAGKMYGCVHYLDIIAPRFNDELLKKLLDIDDNLTVTMHMQTMDPVKAIKMLKAALTNIQKMKIEEQKKAVRSGYDMDILPTDIITYEKDTLELLDDLNTSNQKIIKMTFLITCYGRNKRELENLIQRVSGIIQQANCNLRCMQYLQEQGLMASAPIGCNDTGIERVLTTKSTAILVPFCTQELFMPAPAIYYGLNALSNNMIMADRKRLRTPNGVILGTPGSGKSFSAKREILSCFLMTRDDVIICDPEGEYKLDSVRWLPADVAVISCIKNNTRVREMLTRKVCVEKLNEEKTKKLWGEIIVDAGGQKIEWCYTDVLYSFKSMYLLGIVAKCPELKLVEVCGHTIRPQNRNFPRELAYSEDFILRCIDKCGKLNNYPKLQQFIDVYETVGNVIPVWPGANVHRGQFCCYDCPDIYFNDEKIRAHALLYYQKYSNVYMCGVDAIIDGAYHSKSVISLINMDEGEYENYIKHAIRVINNRTEKLVY